MTRLLLLTGVCAAMLSFAEAANAQVPPFFNQRAALFDPEISVLTTGVANDVQATVSPDRKYVTLNMRASNSELVALREFSFQTGGNANLPTGFAGDPAPVLVRPTNGGAGRATDATSTPADTRAAANRVAPARPTVLTREGMTLVGRANLPPTAGAP